MPGQLEGPKASGPERVEMALQLIEDCGRGIAEAELPAVFAFLARVAEAIVATVGPDCEVVIHDLRKPDHSVVAISGHLTGRRVGAPVPDPELLPGEVDRFTHDDLRRHGSTTGGRELLASTVWIRNPVGHIVGAVCINLDVAGLRTARDLINRHLGQDDVRHTHLCHKHSRVHQTGSRSRPGKHNVGRASSARSRSDRTRASAGL
jgi:predicted transcriptional regulator YheO